MIQKKDDQSKMKIRSRYLGMTWIAHRPWASEENFDGFRQGLYI